MEAVVDAYDSGERAMGWRYYLDGKMKVPSKTRCQSISVLKVEDEGKVLGMAAQEVVRERNVCLGSAGRRANCRPFGATATIVERSRDPGGGR